MTWLGNPRVLIHRCRENYTCSPAAGTGEARPLHPGRTQDTRGTARIPAGSCYVYGTAQGMLPTFRKVGTVRHEGRTLIYFTGNIANRGKGNLFVKDYVYLD